MNQSMNDVKATIEKLNKISAKPLENPELIARYIEDSLSNDTVVTFYNWECPPRFIDQSNTGEPFINYCVDLEKVSQGDKIDRYTEIPRVIERGPDEKKILKYLAGIGIKYRFVKLIADTNALYITPESVNQLGKDKILKANQDFKKFVERKASDYPIPVTVYLYTELIQPFQKEYNDYYQEAMAKLDKDIGKLVPENAYQAQLTRTRDHVGIKDDQWVKSFTDRTIATYAAEGMVFNKLSKTDNFSNCVWFNIEEANDRTVTITNCLRERNNLGHLPMLFASPTKII